jgi:hypothetical protein
MYGDISRKELPMPHLTHWAIFVSISIILASCSGTGKPTEPALYTDSTHPALYNSSDKILWGIWDIAIDSDNGKIDVMPMRGPAFTLNALNFLQPPKVPIELLTVSIAPGTNFALGKVIANVTLQHQFPGTKFCGFDVMGIIMDDYPSIGLVSDPNIRFSTPDNTLLQNPDGWTRWWNQAEFMTFNSLSIALLPDGKPVIAFCNRATGKVMVSLKK